MSASTPNHSIHGLCYTSRRTTQTEECVQKIIEESQKNNAENDLTGVLLYSEEFFIQYLEGSPINVTETYSKIKRDSRHEEVVLLGYNEIEERIFKEWRMKAIHIQNEMNCLKKQFTEQELNQLNSWAKGVYSGNHKLLLRKIYRLADIQK